VSARRIAVMTSGGDAPGMNAAIRAVVRCGVAAGLEVRGVRDGYAGLVRGDLVGLGTRDVSGILGRGGTVLGSARCPEFRQPEVQRSAVDLLRARGVDGLVVIGGNGSQAGAHSLHALGMDVVGVASTIDNDLVGSDVTIGVDTALDIAVEAIDRLKTTAASHHRVFLVEVMGRDCGYLALVTGITGGAEVVVAPEAPATPERVAADLVAAWQLGKRHAIVVVAEGATPGTAEIAKALSPAFDVRVTVLGHVQRGGVPGAYDRLLGSRLGAAAVDTLAAGEAGVLVGNVGGRITATPLAEVVGRTKPPDPALVELARRLAR
jgi:6-phosphofructokinase 1